MSKTIPMASDLQQEGIDISTDNKDDLWIWNKLHWFNFPDLEERPASQDEQLKERILPSVGYNGSYPTYVYMYNGRMSELESINHSSETVEYLNAVAVTFYLNEPMCMYDNSKVPGHTLTFYSEFNGKEIGTNYSFEKEVEDQLIATYLNTTREIDS